ncbi:hypothetical protein AAF712_010700 [Marasmius tenuissimus]|uniref:Nephrocystin 3-like N-terminal domain-containing protein n=1 Tax=Marasmius tenuissimus TaxID=585030 RepID=A0ABR2ZL48_9AGAR
MNDGPGAQNNNNGPGTQNVFVNSFNTAASHPHRNLWDAIAGVGASHNAEQQYERGECLPGTREKVLQRVREEWIRAGGQGCPISWLTGTAGVGKTAIAITLAKDCEQEGLLASSFFFFRSDPKRNNANALVLAIAHGLVSTIPFIRRFIEHRISIDPKILEARLEDQFRELVVNPTVAHGRSREPERQRRWQWSFLLRALCMWSFVARPPLLAPPQVPKTPNIVIIDGLDECSNESTQLRIIDTIRSATHRNPHFPLRFLICSRPESWIRQAFDALPPDQLFKIELDESFRPSKDIEQYYRHHFSKISTDPHYSHISFPSPWPSEEDLEALVEHSSSQFVYAATVVKYIGDKFEHPIEQLRVIIQNLPPRRLGTSPYQQLDALYDFILSANPDQEGVSRILTVLLVFTDLPAWRFMLEPSPAIIELVLGLPAGQVPLTLRAMHSILEIRGPEKKLRICHTSFMDYLVDKARSGRFHIDTPTQKYTVARQWLQNLCTSKVRTYSPNQLYGEKTKPFFKEWERFFKSFTEQTRDLLEGLWSVDLASAHLAGAGYRDTWFRDLVPWVEPYHVLGVNESPDRKVGDHPKAGADDQCKVKAHSRAMDKERPGVDLVEDLVHRLQNRPKHFHLEWPSGVSPQNDVVRWVVDRATGCPWGTRLDGTHPSDTDDVRLTDCHCDLSGGNESCDSGHLAYQEACLQLAKARISLFKELVNAEHRDSAGVFLNMVRSSLLAHCQLDTDLLSLCRMFFGIAKGRLRMEIGEVWEEGRKNMLAWIEVSTYCFYGVAVLH